MRAQSLLLALVGSSVVFSCAQLLGLKEDLPAAPCVLNSDCAPSELCLFRVCSLACKQDKDCEVGARCLNTADAAVCVEAERATCASDDPAAQCPEGLICDANQTCRNDCSSCHDDQSCVRGVCVGSDPNHDPAANGGDGAGGAAGLGNEPGDAGATNNGGAPSGGGQSGGGPTGDAGEPGTVSCGETTAGSRAPCRELPDGTAINFPGGMPQGPCAEGSKQCQSDGTFAACEGAVAPGETDCSTSEDRNCDGKPDNGQCGQCTLAATRYCYDGPAGTSGVGPCKEGTQVCQLDASGKQTVWGPCAGEVTPAMSDTCDDGNDANCNHTKNDGCVCLNGTTATCGSKLQSLGNCAAGSTKCTNGAWGTCSIAPKAKDTCDLGDDSTCNGSANEGCGCLNGSQMDCGTSGTGCTLGKRTCDAGAYGGCAGNTCVSFDVTPPTNKCSANGPKGEDVQVNCTIGVCSASYHVSSCTLFVSSGTGTCEYNGPSGTSARVSATTLASIGGSVSCSFSACSCRHDGF